MASPHEKRSTPLGTGGPNDERTTNPTTVTQGDLLEQDVKQFERELVVTEDDLLEAKEAAASYTLEYVRETLTKVYDFHRNDSNFPASAIHKIEEFINKDAIFNDPEKHEHIIAEMKIQTALIINNSPYAAVRSIVDNKDDPNMPCSTIRAWVIGIFFCAACNFVNTFFSMRLPGISVGGTVPQLLSYPLGRLCASLLPDAGFTVFGVRHSLNPGPFNRKEHMLITIIASTGMDQPYTDIMIWVQYLPQFLNQHWVLSFGYQICVGLAINFLGYGLAGFLRSFLIHPSYCLWPSALVTVALNTAFHSGHDDTTPVAGPLKTQWRLSRMRFFLIAFVAMFVYFWIPNYLFTALSMFAWMTWIAPSNANLATITGSASGLGLNPFPTFDWNIVTGFIAPLEVPFFATFNVFVGALLSLVFILGCYYNNTFSSSYIPIISTRPWDRFGQMYNVTAVLDDQGLFDAAKYKEYSPPYLSAGIIANYTFTFASYGASIAFAALYYHKGIAVGLRGLINSFRRRSRDQDDGDFDVHSRLMKAYREVPQWWYLVCLAVAFTIGCVGVGVWPTNTTPAVIVYGIAMSLVFVVPLGIILATSGVQIEVNVLTEFIGGAIVQGNPVGLYFFKSFGFIPIYQALAFAHGLKLAHYLKIPPRVAFWGQMVPTFLSTFVSVGVLNYQLHIKDICTPLAPSKFVCPGVSLSFTGAVLWGVVGPGRLWGTGGQYTATLVGFPVGVVTVLIFWGLSKRFPKNGILRNTHLPVLFQGAYLWAPLNMSYLWPAVVVGAYSWIHLRRRFLSFWSRYNYVLSAALSTGIALSAIIQFFSVQYKEKPLVWWGNTVGSDGCDLMGGCPRKTLGPGEYFGPGPGAF